MRIALGIPGPNPSQETKLCAQMASREHEVSVAYSTRGNALQNFNDLWFGALNAADEGHIDLFAMMHLDVFPQAGFLDILAAEMSRLGVALLSAAIPIRDMPECYRGLDSCGVTRYDWPWQVHRRVAIAELGKLPGTFTKADFGYPGEEFYTLHNHGLIMMDVRNFKWPDECCFSFPCKMLKIDGRRGWLAESEDWYFSRQAALAGMPSAITSRVRLTHGPYRSWVPGPMQCDEETRPVWEGGLSHPLFDKEMVA